MAKNIAVFASGRGSNFKAIAEEIKKGALKANLALLVCDNPDAQVLSKAKGFGVKAVLVKRSDFSGRDGFEEKIIQHLGEARIELIALAGFMRILGPKLINAYKNKIINIHPALLPSFKGAHAIKDALLGGAKVTGVTVHFVDEEIDHGAIILQEEIKIEESDTLESLELKIHKLEHRLYPEAIKLFLEDKLRIVDGKVKPSNQ